MGTTPSLPLILRYQRTMYLNMSSTYGHAYTTVSPTCTSSLGSFHDYHCCTETEILNSMYSFYGFSVLPFSTLAVLMNIASVLDSVGELG